MSEPLVKYDNAFSGEEKQLFPWPFLRRFSVCIDSPYARRRLAAFASAVTSTVLRAAIAGFGQLAIGTDTGLTVKTPEETVVACGHGGIQLCQYELAFPSQSRAEIWMVNVESLRFADHAAPPVAFMMARFTATRASCTL